MFNTSLTRFEEYTIEDYEKIIDGYFTNESLRENINHRCRTGDWNFILRMIELGIDCRHLVSNLINSSYYRPDLNEVVEKIINYTGLDLNIRNVSTAQLHSSFSTFIYQEYPLQVTSILSSSGWDINGVTSDGRKLVNDSLPILSPIQTSNFKAIQFYVERECNLNEINPGTGRPLIIECLAMNQINLDIFRYLCENGMRVNSFKISELKFTFLMIAYLFACPQTILNILIEFGAKTNPHDVNLSDWNALLLACILGQEDIIREIIVNRPQLYEEMNVIKTNKFLRAYKNATFDTYGEYNAPISTSLLPITITAIFANYYTGKLDFMVPKLLLNFGANPNLMDESNIHVGLHILMQLKDYRYASGVGFNSSSAPSQEHINFEEYENQVLELIKICIDHGVDVNHQVYRNSNITYPFSTASMLMIACRCKWIKIVDCLLTYGHADPNIIGQGLWDNTVLEFAVSPLPSYSSIFFENNHDEREQKAMEITKILLQHGATANYRFKVARNSLLKIAKEQSFKKLFQLLYIGGARDSSLTIPKYLTQLERQLKKNGQIDWAATMESITNANEAKMDVERENQEKEVEEEDEEEGNNNEEDDEEVEEGEEEGTTGKRKKSSFSKSKNNSKKKAAKTKAKGRK
jgi:ankyrin repeat protein